MCVSLINFTFANVASVTETSEILVVLSSSGNAGKFFCSNSAKLHYYALLIQLNTNLIL
jgi:hypothetical protein